MKIEKVLVGSVEYQVPAPITKERSEWTGVYFSIKQLLSFYTRNSVSPLLEEYPFELNILFI